jgi:hypothetical protein
VVKEQIMNDDNTPHDDRFATREELIRRSRGSRAPDDLISRHMLGQTELRGGRIVTYELVGLDQRWRSFVISASGARGITIPIACLADLERALDEAHAIVNAGRAASPRSPRARAKRDDAPWPAGVPRGGRTAP